MTNIEEICKCENLEELRKKIKETDELIEICDSLKEELDLRIGEFGNEEVYREAEQNIFLGRRYLQVSAKVRENVNDYLKLQTQLIREGKIILMYQLKKQKKHRTIPFIIRPIIHKLNLYLLKLDILFKDRLSKYYPLDIGYSCNECGSEISI